MGNLKTWLRLLTVIPLLAVLTVTNLYEDPANIFHDVSSDIANALLDGNKAYIGSGHGSSIERKVKKKTIEGIPKHIECITIGPSLAMGIRKNNVGVDNYYNLSASSLNFNDIMAEFAMLELNNVKYDRVIFCVDSLFFDETRATNFIEREFMPYTEYMMRRLDGKSAERPPEEDRMNALQTQIEQLFSVTYFQSSLELIRSNRSFRLPQKRWGIMDESTQDQSHYLTDGSWVYSINFQNRTLDDVIEDVNRYDIKAYFAYGKHLNDYYKNYFKKLMQYLVDQDVSIEFFLCPLCPSLWDRIESDRSHYFMLDEIEQYANEIADEFGIKVTGSYNPYVVGISDDDFYDARHIRHEKLDSYFDFKP